MMATTPVTGSAWIEFQDLLAACARAKSNRRAQGPLKVRKAG